MKKHIFLIIGFFLFAHNCFSTEITIRVPEGNEYAPFFYQDSSGKWQGLSIELAEALLEETGHTPRYIKMPFSRGLQCTQNGCIDLVLNITITEARKKFLHFIGPQLDETIHLVIKKESKFSITSLDDLKKLPHPIGIERKKFYSKKFDKKRKTDTNFENILDTVNEVDLNEKKLEAGRISGFLGFGYNVFYQIKNNPLYRNFTIHPFIIKQDYVYFGFSKKNFTQKQLDIFREGYVRAAHKGTFEKIKNKYRIP